MDKRSLSERKGVYRREYMFLRRALKTAPDVDLFYAWTPGQTCYS